MSLNRREQAATREELHTNLNIAHLSAEEVATALRLETARVVAALNMDGARPEDAWLVRDDLEDVLNQTA